MKGTFGTGRERDLAGGNGGSLRHRLRVSWTQTRRRASDAWECASVPVDGDEKGSVIARSLDRVVVVVA